MQKFEVLEQNKRFISWFGVHSYRLTEPTNDFFMSIRPYFILCISIIGVISGTVLIFSEWPQIDKISGGTMLGVGCLQAFGALLSFGLNMKKVKKVHLQLQAIIDDQGNSDIWQIV